MSRGAGVTPRTACLRGVRTGYRRHMASDADLERALDSITTALNQPPLEEFDLARLKKLVGAAVDNGLRLAVDDGGGLHDEAGRRVGAIRRTPSGEWIADRQNPAADRAEAPIPAD